MSTLKATNLSHASAASPNIVLDSAGKVTFGGAVAGAGMDLITPTSVAGTGVTVSGGAVSFTAATAVSVNGCFTSTYENYLVIFSPVATASSQTVATRLRLSGTDATGASDYVVQQSLAYGALIAGQTTTSSTWIMGRVNTHRSPHSVFLYAPALAQETSINSVGGASDSLYTSMGYHALATAYDGFTVYPTSSSMTGTLRVYGLRNS